MRRRIHMQDAPLPDNFTQATAQLTQNDVTRAELLHFIERELEHEGIKVIVDDCHGILRIAEGVLFDVGLNNGVFPSNWELSTKRAINTWLAMSNANPSLTALVNGKGEIIFSMSGYADTRPIADNASDNGRRDNRRIDIRFSMAPPTEEDMSIVKFVRKELTR